MNILVRKFKSFYILKESCKIEIIYMSHFSYVCKMRYPLNLVLENSEYLWFY